MGHTIDLSEPTFTKRSFDKGDDGLVRARPAFDIAFLDVATGLRTEYRAKAKLPLNGPIGSTDAVDLAHHFRGLEILSVEIRAFGATDLVQARTRYAASAVAWNYVKKLLVVGYRDPDPPSRELRRRLGIDKEDLSAEELEKALQQEIVRFYKHDCSGPGVYDRMVHDPEVRKAATAAGRKLTPGNLKKLKHEAAVQSLVPAGKRRGPGRPKGTTSKRA